MFFGCHYRDFLTIKIENMENSEFRQEKIIERELSDVRLKELEVKKNELIKTIRSALKEEGWVLEENTKTKLERNCDDLSGFINEFRELIEEIMGFDN